MLARVRRHTLLLSAMLGADVAFACAVALAFALPLGEWIPAVPFFGVVFGVVAFVVASNAVRLLGRSPRLAHLAWARWNAAVLWIALPASVRLVPLLRADLEHPTLVRRARADPALGPAFGALDDRAALAIGKAWAVFRAASDLGGLGLVFGVLAAVALPAMRGASEMLLASVGVIVLDAFGCLVLGVLASWLLRNPTRGRRAGARACAALLLAFAPGGTVMGALAFPFLRAVKDGDGQ